MFELSESKESNLMTMAPGRRKRAYWLEALFIIILLFLLFSSLSGRRAAGPRTDFQNPLQRSLSIQPTAFK
jgi:hypothetical protein